MRKKPVRRSSKSSHSKAFGFALFIGSLVLLLILAALAIKVALIFHQSTFDGKHQFVVAVKEPYKTQFVVFNPDNQSIKTLTVLGNAPSNPETAFSVPVDATAVADDSYSSAADFAKSLVFKRKHMHATMTLVDAINLLIFSHTVDGESQTFQTVSASSLQNSGAQTAKIFLDSTLYKEGKSIAVVNATDISGLGTTIGTLLSNMGGNVVSITTADKPSQISSVAYTGDLSYTASRIAHILRLPLIHLSGVQISDITVTIGTDKANLFQ